jgi:hypothetical protein
MILQKEKQWLKMGIRMLGYINTDKKFSKWKIEIPLLN